MKRVDISDIIDQEATLGQRWLRIGIMAPSGGGKTRSSLELATGMARIAGGPVRLIDTQNGQSADYAERFNFRMVKLFPPFAPQRFLATMRHCVEQGSRVIIVDSMSDEHEGYGGVCDMQEEAEERLFLSACDKAERKGYAPPERDKFGQLAWKEAKAARRELILGLPFVEAHVIFCFKAKKQSAAFAEKQRPGTPKPTKQDDVDGWKPIAGDKLFWDMPLRMLLLPMSKGVPSWNPVAECERTFIRRPDQFEEMLRRFEGKSLCEEMGTEMARWAMGDAVPKQSDAAPSVDHAKRLLDAMNGATTHAEIDKLGAEMVSLAKANQLTKTQQNEIKAAGSAKRATLAEGA